MPSSPRGWLCWAVSVSDRYGRPHSPRYEYDGIPDHRMSDRRETAISVKMALDRATDGNGTGKLLLDFYVREIPWFVFSEVERQTLSRIIKRFRRELQAAGFLPDREHGEEEDRRL
ncbi:MAG: hypothetical protein ACYC24_08760 [Desulfobacteria bacterium]